MKIIFKPLFEYAALIQLWCPARRITLAIEEFCIGGWWSINTADFWRKWDDDVVDWWVAQRTESVEDARECPRLTLDAVGPGETKSVDEAL